MADQVAYGPLPEQVDEKYLKEVLLILDAPLAKAEVRLARMLNDALGKT